jgi:predicted peptidase
VKLTIHQDGILPHLLYQPDKIKAQAKWPLLVFLHGIGERGLDPNLLRKYSLPKFLDEGREIPFIVYAPQCPDLHTWPEITDSIIAGTNTIIANYPINETRLYLTGFSMGGRGLFALAVKYPDAFLAYAPVAGRIPYEGFLEEVPILKDKPLWVFHGAKDTAVEVDNSDKIVAKLREAGATKLQYTRYEDAGHGEASDLAYQNEDLYTWFLNQKG